MPAVLWESVRQRVQKEPTYLIKKQTADHVNRLFFLHRLLGIRTFSKGKSKRKRL